MFSLQQQVAYTHISHICHVYFTRISCAFHVFFMCVSSVYHVYFMYSPSSVMIHFQKTPTSSLFPSTFNQLALTLKVCDHVVPSQLRNVQNPYDIPFYWLVNKDHYSGLI